MLRLDGMRDTGYEEMTCRNHPNLRWTRKSRARMAGSISTNIQLTFRGDVTKPNAKISPWTVSEQQLRDFCARHDLDPEEEVARYFGEGVVSECGCPYADLVFLD